MRKDLFLALHIVDIREHLGIKFSLQQPCSQILTSMSSPELFKISVQTCACARVKEKFQCITKDFSQATTTCIKTQQEI